MKTMKRTEAQVGNNGGRIIVNLTTPERKYLRAFFADLGLREPQIELLFTLIAISNGRAKFYTTYNEISERYHADRPENPKEKKRRRDNIGDRLRRTLASRWRRKNGMDFFGMDTECKGMNETTAKRNPHCVEIDLFFVSKIADIANQGVTDAETKFERLRKDYRVKKAIRVGTLRGN